MSSYLHWVNKTGRIKEIWRSESFSSSIVGGLNGSNQRKREVCKFASKNKVVIDAKSSLPGVLGVMGVRPPPLDGVLETMDRPDTWTGVPGTVLTPRLESMMRIKASFCCHKIVISYCLLFELFCFTYFDEKCQIFRDPVRQKRP